MVYLGQGQAVLSVIMKHIGATSSGADPIAAGITTGEMPMHMGRALKGALVTAAE